MMNDQKRVAIIGSGCSGLGAAWALQSTKHDVHLFEAETRLGGHTNTCTWTHDGKSTPVDTGFIVMNSATYPNLIRFLKEVDVPIVPTSMTFGVSRDRGEFEWSGTGPGIFAQRENIFRVRMWRMIFDIIRFNQFALDLLGDEIDEANGHMDVGKGQKDRDRNQQTIGEYLEQEGYSQGFKDDYLIPMTAAVWSTSPDKASLDFPTITLVRFMWNHHLLSTISARPTWYTIPGGSHRYIDAIRRTADTKRFHVHLNAEVKKVTRDLSTGKRHVSFTGPTGLQTEDFDHIIFANHGDQILPLLTASKTASPLEESILSAFQTTENTAYLHSDLTYMPTRRATWTAWNNLTTSHPSELEHPAGVCLTYWMNDLQHISERDFGTVLVTMNPANPPDPALTQGKYVYEHPLYTVEAVEAQRRLDEIQNVDGFSYCGAWTKYGFHEDGFSSGLKVAIEHLGAELPFEFVDSTFSRGKNPVFGYKDRIVRLIVGIIQRVIVVIEWVVSWPLVAWALAVMWEADKMVLDILSGRRAKRQQKLKGR